MSVNNFNFKSTDKAAYDYYMAVDGHCSKTIKAGDIEIIDGKIYYYCSDPDHCEENYIAIPFSGRMTVDMDKVSELSGKPIEYGPQLSKTIGIAGGTASSSHVSGADIPEYTVLNNGKKVFSIYTTETRDPAWDLRLTSNVSQDSLNLITDFYAKQAGISAS